MRTGSALGRANIEPRVIFDGLRQAKVKLNEFAVKNSFWLWVIVLAFGFAVLAGPALTNAACQNLRAERVLRFLFNGANSISDQADGACGAAPSAVELRALAQLAAGALTQANGEVENFLSAHAQYERARFWAARLVLFAQSKPPLAAAQTAYDLAVKIAPEDAMVWYQRGDFYAQNQMPDRAADSFQNGIRAQPEAAADGYLRLGTMFYQLSSLDQALDAFQQSERAERAAPILPNWQKQLLYFYLGEIYRGRQDWASSAAYYRRALDAFLKPGWPTYATFVGMGDVARATGDDQAAYQSYARAFDFAETPAQRAIVYARLAKWYADNGAMVQALDAYEQAVTLNPNDPWIYFALAQLQERNRQIPQALANYRKALTLNPNLTVIRQALEQLESQ